MILGKRKNNNSNNNESTQTNRTQAVFQRKGLYMCASLLELFEEWDMRHSINLLFIETWFQRRSPFCFCEFSPPMLEIVSLSGILLSLWLLQIWTHSFLNNWWEWKMIKKYEFMKTLNSFIDKRPYMAPIFVIRYAMRRSTKLVKNNSILPY